MTDDRTVAVKEAIAAFQARTESLMPETVATGGGVIHGPWHCMASDRWSMIDANGRQYCEYWTCRKPEGHEGPHLFEAPR